MYSAHVHVHYVSSFNAETNNIEVVTISHFCCTHVLYMYMHVDIIKSAVHNLVRIVALNTVLTCIMSIHVHCTCTFILSSIHLHTGHGGMLR